MIAICRNQDCQKPGGKYDDRKSTADLKGYCTQGCMRTVAVHHGWTAARQKKGGLSIYETLKNAGLVGTLKQPGKKSQAKAPVASQAMVVRSEGAQAVARVFESSVLTFELSVPDDATLEMLKDPGPLLQQAEEMPLESDADYKVMDMRRTQLLDEADQIEAARTSGTKPMNKVKNAWDAPFLPGRNSRQSAALVLAERMKAYDYDKRRMAEVDAQERTRLATLEQDRLNRLADEKIKEAKRMKGADSESLIQQAHRLSSAAQATPTRFAPPSFTDTETAGSSKARLWKGSRDPGENVRVALRSLIEDLSEDWDLDEIVAFKQAGMNQLAKNFKNTRRLKGFKFEEDTNLRRGKR